MKFSLWNQLKIDEAKELNGWLSLLMNEWVMGGARPSAAHQFHSNKLTFVFISCCLPCFHLPRRRRASYSVDLFSFCCLVKEEEKINGMNVLLGASANNQQSRNLALPMERAAEENSFHFFSSLKKVNLSF